MQSSKRLYYQFRMNAGVFAIATITWVYFELESGEAWDNWPALLLNSMLLVCAFAYAGMIFGSLTPVRISDTQIDFYKKGITVPWTAVKAIDYKWFGLYKVTIEEGTFYFPPAGMRFLMLGEDEFDELIDRKKRHLRIGL